MRIIGGKFRGRSISAPVGLNVRPTTDRVREALFNILAHNDPGLEGARVLDLFAGSGALGLEALSRGASYLVLVESAGASRAAIRDNIDKLGVGGQARLLKRSALDLGPRPPQMAPFNLVFMDPPYKQELIPPALEELARGGWLVPGALIAAEQSAAETLEPPAFFQQTDERRYGDTLIRFLVFSPEAEEA